MSRDRSPVDDFAAPTTRRGFLRTCGTAAVGLIGASTILLPARESYAAVPVWSTIPTQVWAVGVPVHLDLTGYCSDADSDPLAFSLNRALPAGVTLSGSVISGTPTGVFSATTFVATADDQSDTIPPAAPTDLREK